MFLASWGWPVLQWISLLEMFFMCPIDFGILYFHLHLSQGTQISPMISSPTHWLFSRILFKFHILLIFPVFSLVFYFQFYTISTLIIMCLGMDLLVHLIWDFLDFLDSPVGLRPWPCCLPNQVICRYPLGVSSKMNDPDECTSSFWGGPGKLLWGWKCKMALFGLLSFQEHFWSPSVANLNFWLSAGDSGINNFFPQKNRGWISICCLCSTLVVAAS